MTIEKGSILDGMFQDVVKKIEALPASPERDAALLRIKCGEPVDQQIAEFEALDESLLDEQKFSMDSWEGAQSTAEEKADSEKGVTEMYSTIKTAALARYLQAARLRCELRVIARELSNPVRPIPLVFPPIGNDPPVEDGFNSELVKAYAHMLKLLSTRMLNQIGDVIADAIEQRGPEDKKSPSAPAGVGGSS